MDGKGMGSLGEGRERNPTLHAPLIHISGYATDNSLCSEVAEVASKKFSS